MSNMNNVEIVIDIETIGENKENFSDYEYSKIEKTLGESPEEYFALYPQTGFIVCICCKNIISGKGFVIHINDLNYKEVEESGFTYYGVNSEKDLLTLFWNLIDLMQKDGYNLSKIISFNGKRFDVPFILLRSVSNSVQITHSLGYKGGSSDFHIDLWEEFSLGRRIRGFSIDIVARMLGFDYHRNENYNGKLVWVWYSNKEYRKIADLCLSDVLLTEMIYKKLKNSWGSIISL